MGGSQWQLPVIPASEDSTSFSSLLGYHIHIYTTTHTDIHIIFKNFLEIEIERKHGAEMVLIGPEELTF